MKIMSNFKNNDSTFNFSFQLALFLVILMSANASNIGQAMEPVIFDTNFDIDADSFIYIDDAFRNTFQPSYANGTRLSTGGFTGGALQVLIGGIDDTTALNVSGGWQRGFQLTEAADVSISLRYKLTQAADYESDELSQALLSVDGNLIGEQPSDYIFQITGDGNGGNPLTTDWQLFQTNVASLSAGQHSITIGGFNNKKTFNNEFTEVLIDDVLLTRATGGVSAVGHTVAVENLDFQRFKDNINMIASFGDRTQGSQSFSNAADWLEQELQAAGYTVEKHNYTFQDQPRENIYVSKIGFMFPDRMYIVSAHFDGRGGGGAADDDGSGSALVLEIARVLGQPEFETDTSVRLIFWNNEETGLNGSTAYVDDRASLRGIENPPGSGIFPEPTWLGIIQHDMILFDHGLPPQPSQIPQADIDIEYAASSMFAAQALTLANSLQTGNSTHSTDYPTEIGSNMSDTDSIAFRNFTAAVSVRENQRLAEIGNGANPNWHQPSDVYSTYSESDFLLGFNALQMTLGTVAALAGTRVDSDGDGLFDSLEISIGTNPNNADSDVDNLSDGFEVGFDGDASSYNSTTDLNPLNVDTDADNFNDDIELANGSDPLSDSSIPATGDINNDGIVNTADIILAYRIALGLLSPTSGQTIRADVAPLISNTPSPDGVINAADTLLITRKALGLASF